VKTTWVSRAGPNCNTLARSWGSAVNIQAASRPLCSRPRMLCPPENSQNGGKSALTSDVNKLEIFSVPNLEIFSGYSVLVRVLLYDVDPVVKRTSANHRARQFASRATADGAQVTTPGCARMARSRSLRSASFTASPRNAQPERQSQTRKSVSSLLGPCCLWGVGWLPLPGGRRSTRGQGWPAA